MKTKDRISRIGTRVVLLLLFLLGVWFTDQAQRATIAAKPESVKTAEPVVSTQVVTLPPWSGVKPANHGTNPIPDGFVQTAVYEDVARLAFPTPAPVASGMRARVLLGEISGATGRHKFVRIEEMANIKENRLVERRVMPADHVAVILHQGKTEAELRAALPEGLVVRRKLLTEGRYLIGFEAKDDSALPGALQKLQGMKLLVNAATADGYVFSAGAGANRICPNDPMFPQQWALQSPVENDAETQRDMDAPEAWALGTGSSSVAVAIIDSGMDYLHPDLAPNLWTNPGETGLDALGNDKATNGLDDDNSGFADDVHGHDFANDDNDAMDDFGHGTHVAGIIGAKGNNGIGISGVCWNVSLVPMKTLTNRGGGIWSDIVDAVNYASRLGLPIANCSFGAYGAAPLFVNSAFEQADNVLFCCAAGNGALRDSGSIVGDNIDEIPFMPAGLPAGHLISVAAHTADASANFLAEFSNYGRASVDIAAPGVGILSTMPGGNYASKSGTSMACAFVSGTAALMRSKRVDAYSLQLRQMLQVCSKQRGHEPATSATGGRVWMWRSLVWAGSGQDWRQLAADTSDIYQIGNTGALVYWGNSGSNEPSPYDDGDGYVSALAIFCNPLTGAGIHWIGINGRPDRNFENWVVNSEDPAVFVGASSVQTLAGKIYGMNSENIHSAENIRMVVGGDFGNSATRYYAVLQDGRVFSMDFGEFGLVLLQEIEGLPPIASIHTNGLNTLCIATSGEVYGWGTNLLGLLGTGLSDEVVTPRALPLWAGAHSFYFSTNEPSLVMAIMNDGGVKACGSTSLGLFGSEALTASVTPISIPGLVGHIEALALGDCAVAWDNRGRVFEWGSSGHYMNPGLGRSPQVLQVPSPLPVLEVVLSSLTSVALLSDGSSFSWGQDIAGVRGLGDTNGQLSTIIRPHAIPLLDGALIIDPANGYNGTAIGATLAVFQDGNGIGFGPVGNSPVGGTMYRLPLLNNAVQIRKSGMLNGFGVFVRHTDETVTGLDGSLIHSGIQMLAPTAGLLFQSYTTRIRNWDRPIGITLSGDLVDLQNLPIIGCPWPSPANIVQVVDGGYGILVQRSDGVVSTARPDGGYPIWEGNPAAEWIKNPDGSPDWKPRVIASPPVAELVNGTYIRTQDGRVFRWPDNAPWFYPAADGDIAYVEVPIPLASTVLPRAPIVKMNGNLALHADGTVTFFGAYRAGPAVADNEFNASQSYIVPEFNDAVDVWSGDDKWFVKRADGSVWAWGNNTGGALGDLSDSTAPTPTLAFGFSDEVSVAVTLGDWLAQYFSEEDLGSINISGDEADPDRDGLVNLVEYALGSDPTVPSDGDEDDAGLTCSFETVSSEALSADGNGNASGELHFTVKLKRRAKRPGIEYRVEFSDDMVNWTSSPTRLLKVLESEKTVIFRDVEPLSVTSRRWARLVIRKGN